MEDSTENFTVNSENGVLRACASLPNDLDVLESVGMEESLPAKFSATKSDK
jgi:hypothetical protein